MNKSKGITLIALTITIVIMLILLGVTVTLSMSGRLIQNAETAKTQTEIEMEQDIIERAQMIILSKNKRKNLTVSTFEPVLKNEAGNRKIKVSAAGEVIEVLFEDTNRYYEIDKNGTLKGPFDIIKQDYTGDITKGGTLDGSEEKPYEINCIEDLVILANRTNGAGNYIDEKTWGYRLYKRFWNGNLTVRRCCLAFLRLSGLEKRSLNQL